MRDNRRSVFGNVLALAGALGGAVILSPVPIALAAPPSVGADDACGSVTRAIDLETKNLSYYEAKVTAETSAPRAAVAAQQEQIELAEIQANLAQLAAHHCPAWPQPIESRTYIIAAMTCLHEESQAMLNVVRGQSAESQSSPSCQRDTWKPSF